MKKNVLITGTSSGLGLETAVLLAKKGYQTFATMRDLSKSNELKKRIENENLNIEILQLDVTSENSVTACIDKIIEKAGSIEILINNAGGGFVKTTEHATEEEMKWVTDLNYFGVVRCTKAVLPLMRKNNFGRIINISSVGGLVGQPFNEFYCAAKFAVEGYTESLASYIENDFGIKFSLIEPGGISTEFIKSAVNKTITNGKMTHPDYEPIFQKYMAGIQKRAAESTEKTFQSPVEVAEIILKIIESENPPLRIRTSKWAEEFCILKTKSDPDGSILLNNVKEKFLS